MSRWASGLTDRTRLAPVRGLSRERITAATIELLDAAGEGAPTVRALTASLDTGRGAIYHHVAGRGELLTGATESVIGHSLSATGTVQDPALMLRALSLSIFDAIDAHPWVGRQLAREPLQPAVLLIWKRVGTQLRRLRVRGAGLSNAGAALVNYVLGAASPHATAASRRPQGADRRDYLAGLAADLVGSDPDAVVQETAASMSAHDDREQSLAGVDIVLAGIAARQSRDRKSDWS
ncbi:hypothetical protein [Nocardioides sp. 1609]|uniref:TetR/AcrR family transcriptional regulator n=1 Tax=Nocardioides sp. 1609 TaxID=2508327 RepID=UPI001ADABF6F|nr:hypothetical protein [Nocardioides sp. 1609]